MKQRQGKMENDGRKNDLTALIHAYELGLLSEKQKREFEILILEDPSVLKDVQDFEKIAHILNLDPEVKKTVEGMVRPAEEIPEKRGIWGIRYLKPSIALGCLLVLILILKPWHIEIGPDKSAFASGNRIIVFGFENKVVPEDPGDLGRIFAGLLTADLSQSHYVQVVPNHRIESILQMAVGQYTSQHDSGFAQYAAQQAGAGVYITGAIEEVDPQYKIKIRLPSMAYPDSAIDYRYEAKAGESIYDLTDRLTVEVKRALRLPEEAYGEYDPRISEITTQSQTAYRFYLEGVKAYFRFYHDDARHDFRLALEYDSTMAMAYYYLSLLTDTRLISRAMQHIDNAGRVEKAYIRARAAIIDGQIDSAIVILKELTASFPDEKLAYYTLGELLYGRRDYSNAIAYLDSTLLIDSTFKLAYNILAYSYDKLGNTEKAIEAINTYIRLAPDEANPLDSRGDIYLNHGMVHEAIESYKQAVKIKPDYYIPIMNLGHAYFFAHELDSAESYFRRANQSPEYITRAEARLYLACLPIATGQFDSAFKMLDDFITADIVEKGEERYSSYRFVRAYILMLLDRREEAIDDMRQSLILSHRVFPSFRASSNSFLAEILAQCGQYDKAVEIISRIDSLLVHDKKPAMPLWYAQGALAAAHGDLEAAIENYEKSLAEPLFELTARFAMGKIYLMRGDYEKAHGIFNDIIGNHYLDYTLWAIFIVQAHYYNGLACENLGLTEQAVSAYERFLGHWGNSQFQLKMVDDARNRLKKLKTNI
jgi:tetratricopeptide (TPR) repeat protein